MPEVARLVEKGNGRGRRSGSGTPACVQPELKLPPAPLGETPSPSRVKSPLGHIALCQRSFELDTFLCQLKLAQQAAKYHNIRVENTLRGEVTSLSANHLESFDICGNSVIWGCRYHFSRGGGRSSPIYNMALLARSSVSCFW